MDNSAIIARIEKMLKERGISKQEFYTACGITSAGYSQWNTGKTTPRASSLHRVADFLGTTYEYLVAGAGPKEKAPALTKKDERDIARDLERIMGDLEHGDDLMFDGVPMSQESIDSLRAAMKLGLEAVKLRNKETYTPKKYRKPKGE